MYRNFGYPSIPNIENVSPTTTTGENITRATNRTSKPLKYRRTINTTATLVVKY